MAVDAPSERPHRGRGGDLPLLVLWLVSLAGAAWVVVRVWERALDATAGALVRVRIGEGVTAVDAPGFDADLFGGRTPEPDPEARDWTDGLEGLIERGVQHLDVPDTGGGTMPFTPDFEPVDIYPEPGGPDMAGEHA